MMKILIVAINATAGIMFLMAGGMAGTVAGIAFLVSAACKALSKGRP